MQVAEHDVDRCAPLAFRGGHGLSGTVLPLLGDAPYCHDISMLRPHCHAAIGARGTVVMLSQTAWGCAPIVTRHADEVRYAF